MNNRIKNLNKFVNAPSIVHQYIVPYSLSSNSRYKHIDQLYLADGKTINKTLGPVDTSIIPTDTNYLQYRVTLADENRLDLVAYKLYGHASLYWVLAYINNIVEPLELPVGTMLYYLPLTDVRTFPNPLS